MAITQVISALANLPSISDPANFEAKTNALLNTDLVTLLSQINTWGGQANALAIAINAVVAGGGIAIDYSFSTVTTATDPTAGRMQLNAATQNTATAMYLDVLSAAGADYTAAIDLFDDSTSAIKGFVMLRSSTDGTKFLLFALTALATPAGFRTATVACVASSAASPFANADPVTLSFMRTGDKGDQGISGTVGGVAGSTVDLLTGTPIASAATINLDTATGNRLHITGTTPITAVTLTRGPRTVFFDGALILTHHASNNNLPGAANITTAAGDRAIYQSDGTIVYCVAYQRADGTALVASSSLMQPGTPGTAVVVSAIASQSFVGTAVISTTRVFALAKNASGYPIVRILDATTGAVLVTSAAFQSVAVQNGNRPSIKMINATQAIVSWEDSTDCWSVVVTDAGASITVGAVLSINTNGGSYGSFTAQMVFSATKVAIFFATGSGPINYNVVTISGSTITKNATANISATAGIASSGMEAVAVSATQGVLATSRNSSQGIEGYVITEAATVLTWSTQRQLVYVSLTGTGTAHHIIYTGTGTRCVLAWGCPFTAGGLATLTITGTGTTARILVSRPTIVAGFGGRSGELKLGKVSTNTIVALASDSVAEHIHLTGFTLSGEKFTEQGSVRVSDYGPPNTSCLDLALMGTTALAYYGDAGNSNYFTAKPTPLGTIV